MGRSSKRKGHDFERKVAKMIAKAFGLSPKECYRTPLSGGHHVKGDIIIDSIVTSRRFPFTIECKHSKAWSMSHLLPLSALMQQWISQTENNAAVENKPALLVLQGNRTPIYALVVGRIPGWRCLNFELLPHRTCSFGLFEELLEVRKKSRTRIVIASS